MTSLIAIPLLVLWIVSGGALLVGSRGGRGRQGGRFADALPPLAVLWVVLAAWLAGWLIAVTLTRL